MRLLARHLVLPVAIALLAAPTSSSAQYGRRQRNASPDEIGVVPSTPPGVAALVLDHAGDFALVDSQRTALESIRRTQDSANKPWIRKLEELRPTSRPINPSDLSQEQRDALDARRKAIAEVMAGMRETNATARQRTMALLNDAQQHRAAELENDARKRAEEDGRRSVREAFTGERTTDQRGRGRPPE